MVGKADNLICSFLASESNRNKGANADNYTETNDWKSDWSHDFHSWLLFSDDLLVHHCINLGVIVWTAIDIRHALNLLFWNIKKTVCVNVMNNNHHSEANLDKPHHYTYC